MDVRVDSGPQDGTVLVTWIPVTLNITSTKETMTTSFRLFMDITIFFAHLLFGKFYEEMILVLNVGLPSAE
jgi:hypothetical protein